jgi:hypothetical protein
MSVDIHAAERFVLATARLLDRRRLAVLRHGAPVEPLLAALRAYRNPDGGFGNALEPDVRAPESEPVAALTALEILEGAGAGGDDMVRDLAGWIGRISHPDGGVPFVMPTTAASPHAPWMLPTDGGSQLTYGLAAGLWRLGVETPWRERGTEWCWERIENGGAGGYAVKFALGFLDAVPDEDRVRRAIETLGARIEPDGTIPVPGGTEDERLTPLALSPHPGSRSRSLFAEEMIEADLDRLAAGQAPDGGWTFDWLAWSPGQEVEWRGAVTVNALRTLAEHSRIELSQP